MPDLRVQNVFQLSPGMLEDLGIRAAIFDVDNTLGPWGVAAVEDHTLAYLKRLIDAGMAVGLLSNSRMKGRRTQIEQQLVDMKIPLLTHARKPSPSGFNQMMRRLKHPAAQTVMIGDQWFTDVLGAKRLGVLAVLVAPVDPRSEPWWAQARRLIEKLILSF